MNIMECQIRLSCAVSETHVSAPEDTHYHRIAESLLEMVRAYESDGIVFFNSGDPVNALASYSYGFGWLHFGVSSGLVSITRPCICPFTGIHEMLQPPFRAKLEEKASRYERLLDRARTSVSCAPDPGTTSYDFAQRVLCIAGVYAMFGVYLKKSGKLEEALAHFSYGHGWLDAGVTAGFFRIMAERDLFTV